MVDDYRCRVRLEGMRGQKMVVWRFAEAGIDDLSGSRVPVWFRELGYADGTACPEDWTCDPACFDVLLSLSGPGRRR